MREDVQSPSSLVPGARVHFALGLGTLAVSHAFIDMVLSVLPPVLPLVVRELGISLGMAGLLVSLRAVASGMAQPVYGLFVDRYGRGWFLPFGILWTGFVTALFGLSGSYAWLAALAVVSGIGGGFYHPVAALMVRRVARTGGAGSFSIFSLGGTIGMALAPLVAVGLTRAQGLRGLLWIGVLACLTALACVAARLHRLPLRAREAADAPASAGAGGGTAADGAASLPRTSSPTEVRHIVYLTAALWARVTTHTALTSFLPLLYVFQGYSEAYGGAVLTLYLAVGSASAVASSYIADRIGRRPVVLASQLLAVPSALLFLATPAPVNLLFLALAAAFLYATVAAGVVYAQELFPSRPGVAAGLIMGTVWALGSLGAAPVGALSDAVGLVPALRWASLLPLLGVPLLWLLPETRPRQHDTTRTVQA